MNLWPIKVVAEKELKDGLRDRRSLRTMLGPLLFGPLIVSFMFHQLAGLKEAADNIRVPVVGSEFASALIDWLRQQSGVDVVALGGDAENALRNGSEDIVLSVKDDFAADFRESRPAPIQILSDSTRKSAQAKVTRLTSLLSAYSAETAALRLISHGVNPEVSAALKVEERNIWNSRQPPPILEVVLMFSLITILTAGMQIAVDSTAGERERGSLEALLLNPVPRWQLVTGKWLAAAAVAFAALVLNLLLMKFLCGRLPLERLAGRFRFGSSELLLLVACFAPAALVGPAIQTYLSCSAKSFKEAQSYSVFLVLPLVFIGVIAMFYPITRVPWLSAIPFLSQYSFGADILGGQHPNALVLVAMVVEAVAVSAVFLWLAARRFASEHMIFA